MVTEMGDLSRSEEIPRDDGMELRIADISCGYIMLTGKNIALNIARENRFYTRNKRRYTVNDGEQ